MENKKQSSVEWLVKELNDNIDFIPMSKWDKIRDIVQQAKEMHKEEIKIIINHYHNSLFYLGLTNKDLKNITEMIYKETFGGQE
jgi:uncharacterized protein YpuA (DUF1002 family)